MQSVIPRNSVLKTEESICADTGISPLVLMENAGRNCAEFIAERLLAGHNETPLILCGKGNNGGDGFVIARHLASKGIASRIALLFPESDFKGIAEENLRILKSSSKELADISECKSADDVERLLTGNVKTVVDCIFGVGLKGRPEDRIQEIIELLNGKDLLRIAVDIPTGLTDFVQDFQPFNASHTLTMGTRKLECLFGKGRESCGVIHVINIGVSEKEFDKRNTGSLYMLSDEDVNRNIMKREVTSNKYSNGKLLIITGSPGLTGASCLSSNAAMRAGCGAVIVAAPTSVFEVLESKLTEVMKFPLPSNTQGTLSLKSSELIREKADWADAMLIGPGLSKNEETMELVRKVVIENNCRMIIDADAIRAFKGQMRLLKDKEVIITPHFGEFAGLIDVFPEELERNFIELAKNFNGQTGATLILKNSPSMVAHESSVYINPFGKENLATAGSGDVLSGIVSAMYAKSHMRLDSAISGMMLHSKAGDLLFEKTGCSTTIAGDLISEIPEAKLILGIC